MEKSKIINLTHESSIKEWLIDALPYEVIWAAENGQIKYANAKFCKRLGYKRSELIRLFIYDINPTVTKESWKNHWDLLKREKSQHFKAVHKDKKGKFYEVEVFSQFFSNNGNTFVCSVINDVTESNFYKSLHSSIAAIAQVGGWKLNLQDNSISVTDVAHRLFELDDPSEFVPEKIIHHFQEPQILENLIQQLTSQKQPFDVILETQRVPKQFIRASAQPLIKGNKVFSVTGIYQDVTEQQKRVNALNFYKDIIDNADDLIYAYNEAGDIIHYSQSVVNQLGFSKEELDRFTIFDLDTTITKAWWKKHFKELKEKKVLRLEWLVTRKDKSKFPADITANYLFVDGVDINCSIVRDVTVRKKRDLKLFEALEEIKFLKEKLEIENEYLQEEISSKINADNIISVSEEYQSVLKLVNQVAPTDTTVLITGESGTGKELLALAIHNNSKRKERPLIKINCATLPKDLIESELFGHRKGAFTGAHQNKVGKFKLADSGTIFLDEIGELPIELQAKLLRVIQEGEFDELGGSKTIQVDVRIIAATNRDLEDMISSGDFREDLYYRLNVFPIHNLPLRFRKDDIAPLAQFFLQKYTAKAGKSFKRLSKRTIERLKKYNFPGNIRELENLIERAVILEKGTTLHPGEWMPAQPDVLLKEDFKSFETIQREYIIEVLKHTNWRVSGEKGAAKILEMKDKTLFAKMKRLGIEKKIILKE